MAENQWGCVTMAACCGSCSSVKSHGSVWCSVGAVRRWRWARSVLPGLPLPCSGAPPVQLVGTQHLQGCENQIGFSFQLFLHKESEAWTTDLGAGNFSWTPRNPHSSCRAPGQCEGPVARPRNIGGSKVMGTGDSRERQGLQTVGNSSNTCRFF